MKATETYYENKIKQLEATLEELKTFGQHLIFIGNEGMASSSNKEIRYTWSIHKLIGNDILDILGENNASI